MHPRSPHRERRGYAGHRTHKEEAGEIRLTRASSKRAPRRTRLRTSAQHPSAGWSTLDGRPSPSLEDIGWLSMGLEPKETVATTTGGKRVSEGGSHRHRPGSGRQKASPCSHGWCGKRVRPVRGTSLECPPQATGVVQPQTRGCRRSRIRHGRHRGAPHPRRES